MRRRAHPGTGSGGKHLQVAQAALERRLTPVVWRTTPPLATSLDRCSCGRFRILCLVCRYRQCFVGTHCTCSAGRRRQEALEADLKTIHGLVLNGEIALSDGGGLADSQAAAAAPSRQGMSGGRSRADAEDDQRSEKREKEQEELEEQEQEQELEQEEEDDDEDPDRTWDVESIWGSRLADGNHTHFEYNIKWLGWSSKHNTFQPLTDLTAECIAWLIGSGVPWGCKDDVHRVVAYDEGKDAFLVHWLQWDPAHCTWQSPHNEATREVLLKLLQQNDSELKQERERHAAQQQAGNTSQHRRRRRLRLNRGDDSSSSSSSSSDEGDDKDNADDNDGAGAAGTGRRAERVVSTADAAAAVRSFMEQEGDVRDEQVFPGDAVVQVPGSRKRKMASGSDKPRRKYVPATITAADIAKLKGKNTHFEGGSMAPKRCCEARCDEKMETDKTSNLYGFCSETHAIDFANRYFRTHAGRAPASSTKM